MQYFFSRLSFAVPEVKLTKVPAGLSQTGTCGY